MPVIRTYQSQVGSNVSVETPRATAEQFGAGVGAALAQGGEQVANEAIRAKRIAEQRDKEDAVAAAGVALAQNAGDTAEMTLQARSNAQPGGAGHLDGVLKDFDAQSQRVIAGIANPAAQSWARLHLAEQRAGVIEREGGWEAGARADKLVGDVKGGIDTDANTLYTAPSLHGLSEALARNQAVIANLNIPEDKKNDLVTRSRARLGASMLQGTIEKDPYAGRALIQSGKLNDVIDADNLASLGHSADAGIKGIEAEQRRAQSAARPDQRRAQADARRDAADYRRQVGDQVRDAAQYLRDGGTLAPGQIGQLATAAARAGHGGLASDVLHLGITSTVNTELRGSNPIEVQNRVGKLQAKVDAAGAKATTVDLVELKAARNFLASTTERLNRDPLSWGAEQGVAPVQAINPADPSSFSRRVDAARAIAIRANRPLAVLSLPEVQSYAARIGAGTSTQRMAALDELRAFGPNVAAAARQLSAVDPLSAHALRLIGGGGGKATVTDMFDGRDAIAANPKLAPKENFEAAAVTALNGALSQSPRLRSQVIEASRLIYAARTARAGATAFSADGVAGAVRAAVGGYRDQTNTRRGGIGTSAGHGVALPDNMSDVEFSDWQRGLTDAMFANGPKPVTPQGKPISAVAIRSMRLVEDGTGGYLVAPDPNDPSAILHADNGNRFVLRVRRNNIQASR